MIGCPGLVASVQSAHACFGYNLMQRIDAFEKPDFSLPTDAQVFTSIEALQSQINSVVDHNGAVYALAPGVYPVSTQLESDGRFNFTISTDAQNPAVIDGQGTANFCVLVGNGNDVSVENLTLRNAAIHGMMIGRENNETGGDSNSVRNVTVHDCGATGITVRNRATNVLIECPEIYNIGNAQQSSGGEGIYLGYGPANGLDQYVSDVTIRGAHIHDTFGEAIDIKRDSRRVLMEYLDIHDINVQSQGAITILLDDRGGDISYDAQVELRYSCIRRVTSRAFNGNAVVAAHGRTLIHDNLMFDTAADVIDVYADCDGANKEVEIYNNILWGSSPVRENVGNAQSGPINNCNITRTDNIVSEGAAANECLENASIFEGPLTTCAGFAPA